MTMKRVTVSTCLTALAALGLLALPACERNSSNKSAEAVEAESAQESAGDNPEEEGSKAGAAAKDKAEQVAKDKGQKKADKNDNTGKAGDSKDGASDKTATVGKPAPDFTLTDATGKKHTLSDYEGKMVVLEWTNPECPYVQRHYKANTMSKTHEAIGEDVVWLAIDSSNFVKPEDSKAWRKKHGFDHPILQNPSGDVGKMYEAKTTPHMYVIDKEGVLRYQGAIDDSPMGKKESPTNYVKQAVQAIKNGEEVPNKSTKPYGCSVKYKG
jgi:peroxiredoxin